MTNGAALPKISRLHGLSPASIQGVLASARALELGRVDEAERQIIGLLGSDPDHPEILRLQAGVQNLRGRRVEAAATMRRALALRPDDALYFNTLGSILIDDGNYDEAIAILNRACALDPDLGVAWFNLGVVQMRSMRPRQAVDAMRRVLALDPDQVNAQCMLADQLKAAGHTAEAVAEYRRVLERHPATGLAWWGLADLKTVQLDAGDAQAIRGALQIPGVADADAITMGFALAKVLDDVGHYEESLDALAEANERARRRQRWNAPAHRAGVDAMLAAFTPPLSGAADARLGNETIFIASMPRSGSTLIEQMLASHPHVEGAGELADLPLVLTEESRRRNQAFPQWVPSMQPRDWERLGRRYLERTAHWRERRPRFTDKLPYNWFYIGAIRAMLPGARIVVARRDPLETCLSCYRQYLVNNEYTRRFDDLAAFWRDFDRAARYWRGLFPAHVRENVHEELLADPESNVRALLAFCDLPFDPACLEFHKTERDVQTPSAAQVRQALRIDTARAARYGGLLDPLRAALGMPAFVPANPNRES
jgi:Tfp pilus assembly protein PilF